ncbi:hypothetical protein [Rossellomorea sp. SC111]|nr:hypothetical protein [Rossellomorea sp. SC111]
MKKKQTLSSIKDERVSLPWYHLVLSIFYEEDEHTPFPLTLDDVLL